MTENKYQQYLIKRLRETYPDAFVFPMDGSTYQGWPDILILFDNTYAVLEAKVDANSHHQPNQDYYISLLGEAVYASFIWPDIEEEVLYGLQQALSS